MLKKKEEVTRGTLNKRARVRYIAVTPSPLHQSINPNNHDPWIIPTTIRKPYHPQYVKPSINHHPMKIEKYIFCLPKAMRLASTRTGISRPLYPTEIFLLYALKRLPSPCTQSHLQRFCASVYNPLTLTTIHKGLMYLLEQELIERNLKSYSLSPVGREYLSHIRRYLINVRL